MQWKNLLQNQGYYDLKLWTTCQVIKDIINLQESYGVLANTNIKCIQTKFNKGDISIISSSCNFNTNKYSFHKELGLRLATNYS